MHVIVYVDVLIFINIIINYCILSLTQKFLCYKTNQIRLILAAFVGAISSLVVFLPIFSTLISYIIKFIVSALICIIAFKHNNLSMYMRSMLSTFVFSVIFCGIMILIYQSAKPENMAIINDTVYFDIDPLILILISLLIYLLIMLIQRIFSQNVSNTLVNLSIHIGTNVYNCIGKIDTGCSVLEPFTGAPVIIIEKSILDNLNTTTRIIPYKVLGHDGILNAVKADKVLIDKKEIEKIIYIGIFDGKIDNQIKAIINSEIVR